MHKAYLICGSTGAGKTTYAKSLSELHKAQIFSIDEWMKTLFWLDAPSEKPLDWALERVGRCEVQIWKVARRQLELGQSVILDLGFSKKEQRDRVKSWASTAGFQSELHFLDIPVEIRRARVIARNQEKTGTYEFEVDEQTFEWMESYFEKPAGNELATAIVIK
jgi:predicted kinase